jgi:hypothetical protein
VGKTENIIKDRFKAFNDFPAPKKEIQTRKMADPTWIDIHLLF